MRHPGTAGLAACSSGSAHSRKAAPMRQRADDKDAPVNNLTVRSQLACSFQFPGIADSRREPMADRITVGRYPRYRVCVVPGIA